MQIVRKVGLWLAVTAFVLGALLFAMAFAFERTLSNPIAIKTAAENSNIYGVVASQITKETATQIRSITGASEDEPGIEAAISAVITQELVQQNLELVVDSMYAWLEGKTDVPDFSLDLTNPKQNIAANLAEQGVLRVQALPACTPAQNLAIKDPDPFTLTCRPEIDPTELRTAYAQQILQNQDFAAITNITAADLTNEQGESVFSAAQQAPNTYQTISLLPLLFFVATAIAVVVAITLHASNIRALQTLLISLAVGGLLMIFSGSSVSGILNGAVPTSNDPEAQATQEAITALLAELGASISGTLLLIGAGTLFVGIGGFIVTRKLRDNTPASAPSSGSSVATHPVMGTDGRVYFVPDQPQPIPNFSPYPQPLTPQAPPTPLPPNPNPPQIPQTPPAPPWHPPQPGEKKWWE